MTSPPSHQPSSSPTTSGEWLGGVLPAIMADLIPVQALVPANHSSPQTCLSCFFHPPGEGLGGELPATMADLDQVEVLMLANNSFTGELPSWLPYMDSLASVFLNNNLFHGRIPDVRRHRDALQWAWLLLPVNAHALRSAREVDVYNLRSFLYRLWRCQTHQGTWSRCLTLLMSNMDSVDGPWTMACSVSSLAWTSLLAWTSRHSAGYHLGMHHLPEPWARGCFW